MRSEEIKKTLETYFEKHLLVNVAELDLNQNLSDAGLIDSFGFIELIQFLEIEFQFKIKDSDLTGKNFSTFNGIFEYLKDNFHA